MSKVNYKHTLWAVEPLPDASPDPFGVCPKCRDLDCRYAEFVSIQYGFWTDVVRYYVLCVSCGYRSTMVEKVNSDVQ